MKKKSGAAQRLISLVLALGLIFTLAPASVFAGDEVPVSSTVTAIADEEPVVDTTEPVVDTTEPVVDTTEPVVDNTEPVVDDTEPVVDDTEPVVDDTEPAVDSTEPTVDGTEPVMEEELSSQTALLAASVPVVMSSRGMPHYYKVSIKADPEIKVYAAVKYQNDKFDDPDWYNDGNETDYVEGPLDTSSDKIYLLFSVPEGKTPKVDFYTGIEKEVSEFPGNIDLPAYMIAEAQAKGITHYCVFTHDDQALLPGQILVWKRKFDVNVNFAETDAYFYLHRYDVAADEVEATDFYYIGKGKVDLSTAAKGITITEGVDSHIAVGPDVYNDIVLNDDVNQRYPGLMTYTYSANGGAGTYSVAKWDMIKGENGATEAYPSGVELVESGTPTWHVDGTVSLNKPEAVFYAQVEGDTTAVYEMGSGYVTFRAAQPNDKVDLTQIIPDKALEKDFLTVPTSFPEIEYNGHNYTYTAQDEGKAFTYTVKGWNEAVGVSGEDGGTTEWRVNGEIKLNTPPEFTNEMKPDVVTTPVVYDGQEHGLTINYKENYPESDFKVTYEVWNEETKTWNKLPDGQLPGQTDAGSLKVKVTFEYLSETAPHLPWPVEVSIKVSQRPLTLTVQDVTIIEGETPSFTVIPSAEGENTGLLTSLGHTLTDDWEVNKDYDNEVAGEYTITLVEDSWVIEDADGNKVTNNYSVTPVAGKLTVKAPLPADLQPTVGNTSSTYDGQAHGLYISYPDGTSASDYKVEYQIAGGAWSETAPSLTNVDKVENVKVRFTYGNYATYEAPDVYSVEVTKRPLTLKVNDDKITDGEPIPSFTYAITAGSVVSGQSITGVTYGGYTDELGIYDVTIKTFKIVAGGTDVTGNYDVTLLPGVFTIGTSGGGGTTPTPNPNPNPTPVPVEPETPVTPVAPVTPDEEEEEPAEVEDIEDEETPQASPDTDADKEEDKTENIEDEETAQAGAPGEGNWALLNLILMALTVVAGLAMLALRFARKTGMAHLLGIVPAIVALVAFFVTEDMSLPMAMTDKWTLIMALIAVVQVVLLVLGRNGAQEDDQPREQY